MQKFKLISIPFLSIIIIFILLNKETTRKIAINYEVSEYKIPIYLKINDFFNRHFYYRNLVKQINTSQQNKKNIILNTSKWVNQNIQKIPEGVDVVDNHPLTIVHRRLGVQDQFSDILSVLLTYSNIDSFFIKSFDKITHPLTLFKVENYWSAIDPYYGVYFINEKGTFASLEELKTSKWQIVNLDTQNITELDKLDIYLEDFQNLEEFKTQYRKIFELIQTSEQIDDTNIFNRGGRSYTQKPLNRLKFEFYKLFK